MMKMNSLILGKHRFNFWPIAAYTIYVWKKKKSQFMYVTVHVRRSNTYTVLTFPEGM